VIQALMLGMEVKIDKTIYRLFRDGAEVPLCNGKVCCAETPWLGYQMQQGDKIVYSGADMRFDQFISVIESGLSLQEAILLAADITLKLTRIDDRKRRKPHPDDPATR
jgi:hypothetical protein